MDLQGGPTFEDLSIDDDLTQLQRVVRYSSSSIALQRLVHVKVWTREESRFLLFVGGLRGLPEFDFPSSPPEREL